MINEMVHTLEATVRFMEQTVEDLTEEEMTEQPPGVPNHGSWTLGHVVFSCQEMAAELGAERWLPENRESVFGYGSTPRPDGEGYPTKAELQTLLAEASGRLGDRLRSADASTLAITYLSGWAHAQEPPDSFRPIEDVGR